MGRLAFGSLTPQEVAEGFDQVRLISDVWTVSEARVRRRFAARETPASGAAFLDHMWRRRVDHVRGDGVEKADGIKRSVIRAEIGRQRHAVDSSFQGVEPQVSWPSGWLRRCGVKTVQTGVGESELLVSSELTKPDLSSDEGNVLQFTQAQLTGGLLTARMSQQGGAQGRRVDACLCPRCLRLHHVFQHRRRKHTPICFTTFVRVDEPWGPNTSHVILHDGFHQVGAD